MINFNLRLSGGMPEYLTLDDYQQAAGRFRIETATLRALAEVESSGSGFLSDGRPKILFESHWFGRFTSYKYNDSHPNISTRIWDPNSYYGGSVEYKRLKEAMELNEEAALKSTSWGKFQIMGFNCQLCGYPDVDAFVVAMVESEACHLDAVIRFINAKYLTDELRDHRWADFARIYNGSGYKKNRYDEKLAAAYAKYSGGEAVQKPSVKDIQAALNKFFNGLPYLKLDGITGRFTVAVIHKFQVENGLVVDGIVGPKTLKALGLCDTCA